MGHRELESGISEKLEALIMFWGLIFIQKRAMYARGLKKSDISRDNTEFRENRKKKRRISHDLCRVKKRIF